MKVFKYKTDIIVLDGVRQVGIEKHSENFSVIRFYFPEQTATITFSDANEEAELAFEKVYTLLNADNEHHSDDKSMRDE